MHIYLKVVCKSQIDDKSKLVEAITRQTGNKASSQPIMTQNTDAMYILSSNLSVLIGHNLCTNESHL